MSSFNWGTEVFWWKEPCSVLRDGFLVCVSGAALSMVRSLLLSSPSFITTITNNITLQNNPSNASKYKICLYKKRLENDSRVTMRYTKFTIYPPVVYSKMFIWRVLRESVENWCRRKGLHRELSIPPPIKTKVSHFNNFNLSGAGACGLVANMRPHNIEVGGDKEGGQSQN